MKAQEYLDNHNKHDLATKCMQKDERINELESALLTAHACIERENVNGIYQNTFEIVTKALKK